MLTAPRIETRAEQPFAAIVLELAQPEIAGTAPPLIADVITWIKAQGSEFSGPPYFNYFEFLPGGRMKMQVGMPTKTVLKGNGRFVTGVLPAGRYATLTHTGPYHELHEANMKLDSWARELGEAFAGEEVGGKFVDATRLEIYHRDPGEDPSDHPVTEVAFRLKD